MPPPVSLILHNANVVSLNRKCRGGRAVAVAGDKIAAIGSDDVVGRLATSSTRRVNCQGLLLVPGLNDAHCHLLATAATFSSLNCRTDAIGSLSPLLAEIRHWTEGRPADRWVRGFGLDPAKLLEGRYPTRQELDWAAPHHPVRLEHASGHAAVLNSLGLKAARIDQTTPDPPEGIIERDAVTGEPTGLLLEMAAFLRSRLGNTRSDAELKEGMSGLSDKLLGYGITSVQDAGPNNGLAQWNTFRYLVDGGISQPRVTMMAGSGKLVEFAAAGLGWGSGDHRLRLGHAKIMLTFTTGALYPARMDLAEISAQCLAMGFPFAVHVIEPEALESVLGLPALGNPPQGLTGHGIHLCSFARTPRNRIEHAAECPPELMRRLAGSGAMVVTQPGFIYWRGDDYLQRVDPSRLPYLYDSGNMLRHNIPVAFSSDAPVIDPSPWPGIYAAVTDRTAAGRCLPGRLSSPESRRSRGNRMTFREALLAYTWGGARAEGLEACKGLIKPGMLADLALLDLEPGDVLSDYMPQTRSRLTLRGGQVVWSDGLDI